MELHGKIINALAPRTGTSQKTGNQWTVQEYVIETIEQYPKRCVFEVLGNDKIAEFGLQVGEEVTIKFDIDAREYNGRWYNSMKAWAVERAQQPAAQPTTEPAPQPLQEVPHDGLFDNNNNTLPW